MQIELPAAAAAKYSMSRFDNLWQKKRRAEMHHRRFLRQLVNHPAYCCNCSCNYAQNKLSAVFFERTIKGVARQLTRL
jgi:hypothetical protein